MRRAAWNAPLLSLPGHVQGNQECPRPAPTVAAARPPRRLSQHISDAFAMAFSPQQDTKAPPAALSGLSGPLMDSVPFMVTLISCGQTAGGAAAPPDGPTSSVLFQNKRSRDYHGPYDSKRSAAGGPELSGRDAGQALLRNMFSMSPESEALQQLEVGSIDDSR